MKNQLALCLVLAVSGGFSVNVMAADSATPAPQTQTQTQTPQQAAPSTATPAAQKSAAAPAPAAPANPPLAVPAPAAVKLSKAEEAEVSNKDPKHLGLYQTYNSLIDGLNKQHDANTMPGNQKVVQEVQQEFQAKRYDLDANRHSQAFLNDMKLLVQKLQARFEVTHPTHRTGTTQVAQKPRRGQKPAVVAQNQGPLAHPPYPAPAESPAHPRVTLAPLDQALPEGSAAASDCAACRAAHQFPPLSVPQTRPLQEVAATVAAPATVHPATPVQAAPTAAVPTRQPFTAPADLLGLNQLLNSNLFGQSPFVSNPLYNLGLTPARPLFSMLGNNGMNPLLAALMGMNGGLTPANPLFPGQNAFGNPMMNPWGGLRPAMPINNMPYNNMPLMATGYGANMFGGLRPAQPIMPAVNQGFAQGGWGMNPAMPFVGGSAVPVGGVTALGGVGGYASAMPVSSAFGSSPYATPSLGGSIFASGGGSFGLGFGGSFGGGWRGGYGGGQVAVGAGSVPSILPYR